MNIDQLNDSFGIQDQVTFVTGSGGLTLIKVSNQSASAVISLYGGQILSFKPADEKTDMLFLSKNVIYEDGKAIRGGIPLCWPWFGPDPEGLQRPNHGFAVAAFRCAGPGSVPILKVCSGQIMVLRAITSGR